MSDDRIRCRAFAPGEGPVLPPVHPIYRERVRLRVSLNEVAAKIGVTPQELNEVEQGRVASPGMVRRARRLYAEIATARQTGTVGAAERRDQPEPRTAKP